MPLFDEEVLHNPNNEEDTEYGLHPCKIVGTTHKDNEQFVLIELKHRVQQYARIIHSFPLFGYINKKWIDKYKDSVIGYIAYERGYPDKPLLISIAFKDGSSFLGEGHPRSVNLVSEFVTLTLSDEAKTFVLDLREGSKAYFGSKDSNEALALGNKLKSSLDDLTDQVSSLAQAVQKLTVATAMGPSGPPNNLAEFITIDTKLKAIKAKYNQFLSTKNFTE